MRLALFHRSGIVATALLATIALVLCFVPLFNLLAYEFCFAIGICSAFTSLILGLSLARSAPRSFSACGQVIGGALLHLMPALIIITTNGVWVRNCNYSQGMLFFLLLPVCSSIYCAVLGLAVGQVFFGRTRMFRFWVASTLLVSALGISLWRLYWQPPIVAYDHIFGHFAGSLYDEVIAIDRRLVMFRAGTFLRVLSIAFFLFLWHRVTAGLSNKRRLLATTAGLVVLCIGYEFVGGSTFGFRLTRDDILQVLSVEERAPGLVIHLPPNVDAKRRAEIVRDHSFRLQQLQERLELRVDRPIHSFMYADANQKAWLMGGRNTMVAKPWLFEIHVNDLVAPHPVVAHELAHVVAAMAAPLPLRVSSRWGVFANMALVEGLAEGITAPRGDLDLPAFTRAMQTLGLAPNLENILGASGFWSEAPRRAYTTAGAFVRYLLDTHGARKLQTLYAHGDFEAAYGVPLQTLLTAWQKTLEETELAPFELRLTEEQFRTPSIFSRTCAHEIAALKERASRLSAEEAIPVYKEICTHLGSSALAEYDLAMALLRAEKFEEFSLLAERLLQSKELTVYQKSQLLDAQSDLAWKNDDRATAAKLIETLRSLPLGPVHGRFQWVRQWALEQEKEASAFLRKFLREQVSPALAMLKLEQLYQAARDKTVAYLIGRALLRADAPSEAESYLNLAAGHPEASIEAERLRLLAEVYRQTQRYTLAQAGYETYASVAPTSGEKARALDDAQRCHYLDGLSR